MQVISLKEQLFFSTTKILAHGINGRVCAGTAFFYSFTYNSLEYPFLVTNRHMVDSFSAWSFSFFKTQNEAPVLDKHINTTPLSCPWFFHPNNLIDVAVTPLGLLLNQLGNPTIFYRQIPSQIALTDVQAEQLDAIEDVIFIGYPNGFWDDVHHLPIARRGITASPLSVDFNGLPQFIIDASVFGGSSGSPVFIMQSGLQQAKDGSSLTLGVNQHIYFIGIVASLYNKNNDISIVPAIATKQVSSEALDIGTVFKAKSINETILAALHTVNVI